MKIRSEELAPYGAQSDEDAVIQQALTILRSRVKQPGTAMSNPQTVRDFLTLAIGGLPHEEFHLLLLDAQNRLIEQVPLFRGTLTQASVYPREVVKEALKANAACVILAHNHPSGRAQPSSADRVLTTRLKEALALIDVKVIDHFVVTAESSYSFAEHGEL